MLDGTKAIRNAYMEEGDDDDDVKQVYQSIMDYDMDQEYELGQAEMERQRNQYIVEQDRHMFDEQKRFHDRRMTINELLRDEEEVKCDREQQLSITPSE